MGMFDTIRLHCPHCGHVQEVQSKAGPCHLREYELEEAPLAIIAELKPEQRCPSCYAGFRIVVQSMVAIHPNPGPRSREEEEDDES